MLPGPKQKHSEVFCPVPRPGLTLSCFLFVLVPTSRPKQANRARLKFGSNPKDVLLARARACLSRNHLKSRQVDHHPQPQSIEQIAKALCVPDLAEIIIKSKKDARVLPSSQVSQRNTTHHEPAARIASPLFPPGLRPRGDEAPDRAGADLLESGFELEMVKPFLGGV